MSYLQKNLNLLRGLEPADLYKWFVKISSVDRGSGREKALADMIVSSAKKLGRRYLRDEVNNVVIYLPAHPEYRDEPSICLQGHLDMVPVGTDEKDFDTSQVEFVIEDGKLSANGTSLGADNGIAVAAMLTLMGKFPYMHGPLELLFTTDEERGLEGAKALDPNWIKSHFIVNLDSEDWGEVTLGCAGGGRIKAVTPIEFVKPELDSKSLRFTLELSGLLSGHSGMDINKGRANAIVLLAEIFQELVQNFPTIRALSFNGGHLSNNIPAQSSVFLALDEKDVELLPEIISVLEGHQDLASRGYDQEPDLQLVIKQAEDLADSKPYFSEEFCDSFLEMITNLPCGVISMDPEDPTMVQSSNNVAIVKTMNDVIETTTMYRSSSDEDLKNLKKEISEILLKPACSHLDFGSEYPAWQPKHSSQLLKLIRRVALESIDVDMKPVVVHAGLECLYFAEKWPDKEMISYGPTIKSPHSQNEYVVIETIEYFWHILILLISQKGQLTVA